MEPRVDATSEFTRAIVGEFDDVPDLWPIAWAEAVVSMYEIEHDWDHDEDPDATSMLINRAKAMFRSLRDALAKAYGGTTG